MKKVNFSTSLITVIIILFMCVCGVDKAGTVDEFSPQNETIIAMNE